MRQKFHPGVWAVRRELAKGGRKAVPSKAFGSIELLGSLHPFVNSQAGKFRLRPDRSRGQAMLRCSFWSRHELVAGKEVTQLSLGRLGYPDSWRQANGWAATPVRTDPEAAGG